jgi:hypothetical protein
MTQTDNQQHSSRTAAIADDYVAIFTGGARGAEDMQMQAKKIDGFLGRFTLMKANIIPKCAATGILHGAARAAKTAAGGLSAQQLTRRPLGETDRQWPHQHTGASSPLPAP